MRLPDGRKRTAVLLIGLLLPLLAAAGVAVAIDGDSDPESASPSVSREAEIAAADEAAAAGLSQGWGTTVVTYPPETIEAIEQASRDGKVIGVVPDENGVARVDRVFDSPEEAAAAVGALGAADIK